MIQSATYNTQKQIIHDHTKYIEADYHLIRDVVVKKLIYTLQSFIRTMG